MPFENVRQLENSDIRGVENLDDREKRVFMRVFNKETYGGSDKKTAIKKAFGAAKRKGSEGHKRRT